jgi:hypothetical protein
MREKIKYTDEPLGDLKVIPDFLPRPEDLIFRDPETSYPVPAHDPVAATPTWSTIRDH